WLEGKHQATLPEVVLDQSVETVLVRVGIETSISIQLSAFDQRFLHHLDIEISLQ
ncbi:hypothetical protein J1N35_034202, partial [Gossypium stocksii]